MEERKFQIAKKVYDLCKQPVWLIILMTAAVIFAGIQIEAQTVSDKNLKIRKAIEETDKQLTDALARGDGAAMGLLYAEDAQLLPPNEPAVSGRKAIGEYWQGAISAGIKNMKLEIATVEGRDDLAYEQGAYTVSGADGKVLEVGKFIVVWKRINNRWMLYRDMWSSNSSPQ